MKSPENPKTYQGKQVIINSDRLVFNAKEDSILLYSDKHIGFSTNGNFHFDTDNNKDTKFIVNAPNIYLGLKDQRTGDLPTEPAVLSIKLEKVLEEILDYLIRFAMDTCFGISNTTTIPGEPTGFNSQNLPILYNKINEINKIKDNLKIIRSRNTKLI